MMKYALILFISIALLPIQAVAQETPTFKEAQNYKEQQITLFVGKNANIALEALILAPIDLNNDSIDEYIVKPAARRLCNDSLFCPHQIIAFQNREPIKIGQFDAHKILVSYKKTYGVRDIIVYNVQHNDFKSQSASWSPLDFMFTYN